MNKVLKFLVWAWSAIPEKQRKKAWDWIVKKFNATKKNTKKYGSNALSVGAAATAAVTLNNNSAIVEQQNILDAKVDSVECVVDSVSIIKDYITIDSNGTIIIGGPNKIVE